MFSLGRSVDYVGCFLSKKSISIITIKKSYGNDLTSLKQNNISVLLSFYPQPSLGDLPKSLSNYCYLKVPESQGLLPSACALIKNHLRVFLEAVASHGLGLSVSQ